MSSVLQIVDTDRSTLLLDLNDPTGANAWGVQTYFAMGGEFALGVPEMEFTRFAPESYDGGTTLFSRAALSTCAWRSRFVASSTDNMLGFVGELAKLLSLGGTLKWIPNGSTQTRFIMYEPSPAPALFAGRELELYNVTSRFDTPAGVLIALVRQPYLEGAEITAAFYRHETGATTVPPGLRAKTVGRP